MIDQAQKNGTAQKKIEYSRVISLSHIIHRGIPLWPGDPPVEFEIIARLDEEGYYLRRFCMGEHSATHVNAPNSFFQGGAGLETYEPAALVVPAVVIEARAQCAANPDTAFSVEQVLAWEAQHEKVPKGSLVILHTGWEAKWVDPQAYLNQDGAGELHFPGFSGGAAQYLMTERQAAGLGIDTHGVDPGQDIRFLANRAVLERQGIVLENLANLDQLPPTGVTLVIGILYLQGGSGSPAAVTALLP
jgi:kynurenine formamidase